MPDTDPIALNLARIFHRIATDPRGWRVDLLRDELRISERTYRKYRKLLQDHCELMLGGRERRTAEVREAVDGDARYLRIVYPDEEAADFAALYPRVAGLYLARQLFDLIGAAGVEEAVAGELSELRERLQDGSFVFGRLLRNADRLFHMVPDAPKDYGPHEGTIRELFRAMVHAFRVRIGYATPAGGQREHMLDPLTIAFYRGSLYLVARYPESGRIYTFVVDRMRSVEVTCERFAYPPPEEYAPERFLAGSFGIFTGSGAETIEVELLFDANPWLVGYISERRWHPTQRIERLPDGRLRLSFSVDTLVEVRRWVRGFGREVTVVRPEGLLEEMVGNT